ncbi:MAG: ABC-three component system middle component 1 [Acetobacterium sp.]
MISLLKKIYKENHFILVEDKNKPLFSKKGDQEYYITVHYLENEIENFFESDDIIDFFKELNDEKIGIEKNTSLIICVEVENIETFFSSFRNMIFKIEEDQYFFRKYIIVYSKKSIIKIDYNKNIEEQMNKIVKKDRKMDEYQKEYFKDEEFFVSMQLFIKLPFLKFSVDQKEYIQLDTEIENNININKKILGFDELYKEKGPDDYFTKLEAYFLSETNDEDVIIDFFKYFERCKL